MAEIEKIKPRSFQLSETNMEILEQVNKELGAATWNEVFTNLLQRFYDPIKVNDKNSEEIKSLRASNEDLRANLRDKILLPQIFHIILAQPRRPLVRATPTETATAFRTCKSASSTNKTTAK